MIILEHSTYDQSSIAAALGAPEYSYWFVRKSFRRVLAQFGILVPVATIGSDTDPIVSSARRHGSDCILFSFNPPQYLPQISDCAAVPIFAWEFDQIPDQSWNANPQEDWRVPLSRAGMGITHSRFAVDAVRQTMGIDFPIWSIPAPVFDPMQNGVHAAIGYHPPTPFSPSSAIAIDLWAIDLDLFAYDKPGQDSVNALRALQRAASSPAREEQSFVLDGVVYTSVLNPGDGRKNWEDMVAAFVFAFRGKTDATLILKLTSADLIDAIGPILGHIAKLGAFRCRIILIYGLLSDDAYGSLIGVTSYAVNASQGEGQCLPLMEFMSAGKPAVAPRHTAMLDYHSRDTGFIVPSHLRPGFWPHDERQFQTCLRHEIAFDGLVDAFRDSYAVAAHDGARYAALSKAARASLRSYCGDEVVHARLSEFFRFVSGRRTTNGRPTQMPNQHEALA